MEAGSQTEKCGLKYVIHTPFYQRGILINRSGLWEQKSHSSYDKWLDKKLLQLFIDACTYYDHLTPTLRYTLVILPPRLSVRVSPSTIRSKSISSFRMCNLLFSVRIAKYLIFPSHRSLREASQGITRGEPNRRREPDRADPTAWRRERRRASPAADGQLRCRNG